MTYTSRSCGEQRPGDARKPDALGCELCEACHGRRPPSRTSMPTATPPTSPAPTARLQGGRPMSYLRRTRLWRASLSPTADPTAGHRAPRRSSWPRSTGSSACEASRAPVASFRITRPLSMPPPDVRVVLNADEAARSAASARDRSRWSARNRVPDAGRGFRHEASILPLARAQSEGSLLLFDHLDSFRPPGDGPARLLLGHPNARAPTTASLPLRTSVGCLGDEPPASGSPRRTEGTVSDGDAARGALPGRSRSCIRRWKRSSRQGRCRRSLGTICERAVRARRRPRVETKRM